MNSIVKFSVFLCTIALLATSCKDNDLLQEDELQGGSLKSAAAVIDLGLPGGTDPVDSDGNVTVSRNLTLSAGNTYILHNYFRVQDGYTITIQAGVTIQGETKGATADDIAPGTLVIERGGQINAQGTYSSPIVFTSNQCTSGPAPGDWGGVVILGKADVNISATGGSHPSGTAGLGFIEGLPTPNNTGRYGNGDLPSGNYNTDNSGTLQYVRIEYAGDEIGEANELNGLTLAGVGSNTTIDHVMVSYGYDDAFEFFGGTVNAKYLIANRNRDDDFDTDQGYKGKIQFGISYKDPDQAVASSPVGGIESNGDNDDDDPSLGYSLTDATFSNLTIIGPIWPGVTSVNTSYRSGALIRDASELDVFNSIVTGYPTYQFELEDPADFGSTVFAEGVTLVFPTFSGFAAQCTNVTGFTSVSSHNNECLNAILSGTAGLLSLPGRTGLSSSAWEHCSNAPNLVPTTEKASDFSSSLLDGFFTEVDFRGAFGNSSDPNNAEWHITDNWVNWCPSPCN